MKKILIAHTLMMEFIVMIGELIGKVNSPTTPMDVKFPLAFMIL